MKEQMKKEKERVRKLSAEDLVTEFKGRIINGSRKFDLKSKINKYALNSRVVELCKIALGERPARCTIKLVE